MDSPCPNSPILSLSLSLYPSSRPLSLSSSPIPSNGILDCAPYQRGTPAQSEGLHYSGRELSDEITYFFFSKAVRESARAASNDFFLSLFCLEIDAS